MIQIATTSVLLVTFITTFMAFRRREMQERWMFKPNEILRGKQYWRMFTSGFIHADWIHFGFNAISFLSFAENIERSHGAGTMLVIYFSAIFGGSLLSLIIHRNHEYSALGASGGVCGMIFASIFLLPGIAIDMFFLIRIPSYIYAVLFIVGSYVAHRRASDNVGHDAHLGGAIIGLLVATAMYPELILSSPKLFATVLVLSLVVLMALIFDPLDFFGRSKEVSDVSLNGDRARRYTEIVVAMSGRLRLMRCSTRFQRMGYTAFRHLNASGLRSFPKRCAAVQRTDTKCQRQRVEGLVAPVLSSRIA